MFKQMNLANCKAAAHLLCGTGSTQHIKEMFETAEESPALFAIGGIKHVIEMPKEEMRAGILGIMVGITVACASNTAEFEHFLRINEEMFKRLVGQNVTPIFKGSK